MISVNDIKDILNSVLYNKFNECTYYTERLPKDFERPSFYIDFITTTFNNININTLVEEYHFQLLYIGEVDEYNTTNNVKLHEILQKTMYLFRRGFIRCHDRFLTVTAKVGDITESEFVIDLKFTIHQEVLTKEDKPEYEMIENINIKRR